MREILRVRGIICVRETLYKSARRKRSYPVMTQGDTTQTESVAFLTQGLRDLEVNLPSP